MVLRYPGLRSGMQNFYEKFSISSLLVNKFTEIYATIDVNGQLGYKRGSLSRLNSEKRLCETNF
jgi:hypothetical protein